MTKYFDEYAFTDYQDTVSAMPLYDDPILGLIGEVGEIVEHVKKDRRPEGRRKPMNIEEFTYELGDALWYLTRTASEYGIQMSDVALMNITKLDERHKKHESNGGT